MHVIDQEFATKQVSRFTCLGPPPASKAGVDEIIQTLMEAAHDRDHAVQVVSEICRDDSEARRWPTPATIWLVARNTPFESAEPTQHREKCPNCDGHGWIRVWWFTEVMGRHPVEITEEQYNARLAQIAATKNCRSMAYEGVRPCTCRPPRQPEPVKRGR